MKTLRFLAGCFFFISASTLLQAAPQLRLVTSTVGPVTIAAQASGGTQTVEAYNAGSGSLNLSLASSVSWITATVGSSRTCTSTTAATTCIPLNFALNTQSLSAGTVTGIVTVSDPNAVDAPQTITVTVAIGGTIPDSTTFYVAPGGTASLSIPTDSNIYAASSASWLTLSVNGSGSFAFVRPFTIQVTDTSAYPAGSYTGTLKFTGSSFAPDNKTVTVTMNVTTQPIAQPSTTELDIRMAQGAPAQAASIGLTNAGQGTLVPSTVAIATSSCGNSWITYGSSVFTIDATGLSPGVCNAVVTLASNAVNGAQTVPVVLTVVAKGAPVIAYQGAQNNATFVAGETVAQGDIMALKGDQLSFQAALSASAVPLPTQLADTAIYVNGVAVPLYYSSYGQINFQMPVDTATGTAIVQVKRTDGTASNQISVPVAARAPRLLEYSLNGVNYAIAVNPDYTFPWPAGSISGLTTHAAHAGDTMVFYGIGLGATNPVVATGTGAAAPTVSTPVVQFGSGIFPATATPLYTGLNQYVGEYQINVTIPSNVSTGTVYVTLVFPDGTASNSVAIAIQ